jgi:hypothetical protein
MNFYDVTIKETLIKVVTVKASSLEEAQSKVAYDWKNEKHILTADDFSGVRFYVEPHRYDPEWEQENG